jgi:MFS family permease
VVLNRYRGGSYLAIGFTAIGLFGIFLFLTYYMQLTLHYSPVKSGLAFLPSIAMVMIASTVSTAVLMPRIGPRPLVPLGMLLAAAGVALLRNLGLHTSYNSGILPGLILVGLGLGLVFGCAINSATYGAAREDAGVASAMVNTSQQVGGSIGTALLNSIAASAVASYLLAHAHEPEVLARAAVHSYVVSFTVVLGIFIVAAIVSAAVLPSGVPRPAPGEPAPLPA